MKTYTYKYHELNDILKYLNMTEEDQEEFYDILLSVRVSIGHAGDQETLVYPSLIMETAGEVGYEWPEDLVFQPGVMVVI